MQGGSFKKTFSHLSYAHLFFCIPLNLHKKYYLFVNLTDLSISIITVLETVLLFLNSRHLKALKTFVQSTFCYWNVTIPANATLSRNERIICYG